MRKLMLSLIAVALIATTGQAQVTMTTPDGTQVGVTFFNPRTVHITKTPKGKALRKSLVVTAEPQQVDVRRGESGSEVTLSSNELTVRVNKKTGRVAFEGLRLKNLLSEQDYSFEERTSGPDRGACRVNTTFRLQKDEPVYGLGTLQDGLLSHRGKHVVMEQDNLEDFQLVLQSIRGWALYWDNYSRTVFDSPKGGTTMSLSSEVGDGVDYYLMLGGSADNNIREMRALSGQVPMFPLWTYGYWQSKERYKSSKELLDVVKRYRQEQVPIDGIIQDWQYWGSNYTWNAMEFNAEEFQNGKQMIDEVHRLNAHFMISIWASFGPMTKQFHELDSLGLLYDFETWPESGLPFWPPRLDYPSGVRVYDAFNPVARDIYWRYLKNLLDAGTDAWWMDSTDPDFKRPKDSNYDHKAGDGTWRRYRNAFPLATVSGVYDNQRATTSDKRVFIMTRSAFAGQQRYGSGLWSGDVQSSWDMLRKQLPLGQNYSLTGCPNFNTDIGGFFSGSYNRRGSGSAPRNPQFQELYVRWMQYGLFCPVFRSHGTECAREVWEFGKKGELVYDAIAKQIRLRYRLLPYLYSTAWQVTSAGESYMRPLWSDFSADRRTWEMGMEFLFGRSILAAPIVEAQYTPEEIDKSGNVTADFTATKTATKYLPKGAQWYDFWTGKLYKGGQDVLLTTTFDQVPMFVCAGSILPLGPEMQYVGEKSWQQLELRVYPGADGQFTLYEDEGDNYNYEKGQYTTIPMTWNNKTRTLTVGQRQGQYKGMLQSRQFTVVLPDGTQKTVDYQGAETTVTF
jgi:alpha-D-xyloside xylohydrolase